MTDTIFTISPGCAYFNFGFLVAIASALGIIIYLVLRKPEMRRPELRYLWKEPTSNRSAIIAGLIIALPFMIYAYVDNWQHFYGVSVNYDLLYIHYRFPERDFLISDLQELKVTTDSEVRKGIWYRIILTDSAEHEYTSQLMTRQEMKASLAKLNDVLKQYNDVAEPLKNLDN